VEEWSLLTDSASRAFLALNASYFLLAVLSDRPDAGNGMKPCEKSATGDAGTGTDLYPYYVSSVVLLRKTSYLVGVWRTLSVPVLDVLDSLFESLCSSINMVLLKSL